jgi:hypothetical protein
MRRHRLSRPDWTGFARGGVADREDEIQFRRAGAGELVPALRPEAVGRVAIGVENPEREGVDPPLRMAACGERVEVAPSLRKMLSAKIERALLPVQRNRTLKG